MITVFAKIIIIIQICANDIVEALSKDKHNENELNADNARDTLMI